MPAGPHICVVCGQRIGSKKGQWWTAVQPCADGAYRCRICQDVGAALATVTAPAPPAETPKGDGE